MPCCSSSSAGGSTSTPRSPRSSPSSASFRSWRASTATSPGCGRRRAQPRCANFSAHTSGAGYEFLVADIGRWYEVAGVAGPLGCSRDFLRAPLVADPGTEWNYGTGLDWAGVVLEAVTGTTLESYLVENVLSPLRMGETTFRLTDDQRARLMPIHHRTPDGGLAVDAELELPHDPSLDCAGHGAYSTVGDYGRFLRMLLRGGELDGHRILDEETVELAISPQLGAIELPKEMPSADHELCNDVVALPFQQSFGLSFNLMLEDIPGMRRAGTASWSGLANCYYWIDRATGIAGLFMTSVLPFFDEQILLQLAQLEMAAYAEAAEPVPPERQPARAPRARRARGSTGRGRARRSGSCRATRA